jgi:hypothetical protein
LIDQVTENEVKNVSSDNLREEYKNLLKMETFIARHKENKDAQRRAFKSEIDKLQDNQAILLMDFKENVKLGGSAREVSSIFYSSSSRTYFTILVILKGNKHHYFDFVSEDLKHDASFVI